MTTQKRLVAWLVGTIAMGVVACAEGAPADPVNKIDAPVVMAPPPCGNGKMDPGEDCECPDARTRTACKVDNMTCANVGAGTGTLLCNAPPQCTFNLTMCSAPRSGSGGSGR